MDLSSRSCTARRMSYFGFALLLMWIGYMLDTLKADQPQLLKRILIANLIGGAATLSREAYGAVFVGVLGAYVIAQSTQQRRILWRELIVVVLSSLTALSLIHISEPTR